MSSFEVSPTALEKCGEAIGTAAGSLSFVYLMPVSDYIDKMTIEDTGSRVFSHIYMYNEQVMGQLRTDTMHVSSLLVESGSALSASADAYRKMDDAARERYDRQYHPGGSVELDSAVTTGGSTVDTKSALTPPEAGPGAGYDLIDKIISWTDWTSITGDALKLAGLFGLHPTDQLTGAIFGDYESLSKNADALRNLAECDELSATYVQQKVGAMLTSWHGNAADGADHYFVKLSNAFGDRADTLRSSADGFDGVSAALGVLADDLAGALQDALDAVLVALASIAAAGCLAEVPILDVVVAAVGAYEAYRATKAVERFVKLCQDAWDEIDKARQGFQLLAGLLASYDVSTRFPTAPYVNASLPQPRTPSPSTPGRNGKVAYE